MLDFILFFVDFSDMPPPVISSDEVYAAFGGVLWSNAERTHDFAEGELFANRLRAKVFTWMIACSLTTDKHRLKEELFFFGRNNQFFLAGESYPGRTWASVVLDRFSSPLWMVYFALVSALLPETLWFPFSAFLLVLEDMLFPHEFWYARLVLVTGIPRSR